MAFASDYNIVLWFLKENNFLTSGWQKLKILDVIFFGIHMPQLDLFSYFSAATYLILSFLILVFILHTYYLPKIATVLKFRKKMELKNLAHHTPKTIANNTQEDDFLSVTHKYINEMEKITKVVNK